MSDFCDNRCTWLNHHPDCDKAEQPAQQAEINRLVSSNNQLMDEVARLNKAVADAIAKEREKFFTPEEARIALDDTDFTWHNAVTQDMVDKLMAIRARGNT